MLHVRENGNSASKKTKCRLIYSSFFTYFLRRTRHLNCVRNRCTNLSTSRLIRFPYAVSSLYVTNYLMYLAFSSRSNWSLWCLLSDLNACLWCLCSLRHTRKILSSHNFERSYKKATPPFRFVTFCDGYYALSDFNSKCIAFSWNLHRRWTCFTRDRTPWTTNFATKTKFKS